MVYKTYTNQDYGKLFANYEDGDAVASDHEDLSPDYTPTLKADRQPLGATELEIQDSSCSLQDAQLEPKSSCLNLSPAKVEQQPWRLADPQNPKLEK